MRNIYDRLKDYSENTPKEILERIMKDVEHLNEIGLDVLEYAEYVNRYFRRNSLLECQII